MIELREVNAKSDIWIHYQEIVHFAYAAVVSFITRGVAGIQNNMSDAIVTVYGRVKIAICLK